MTRTVVTGVDASQTAFRAAAKAAELAENSGAVLHICSAYSTNSTDALSTIRSHSSGRTSKAESRKLIDGVAKASEQVGASVAVILRESHPGLTIDVSAVPGAPAEALLRKAEELDADVIVVGNKNIRGVSRVPGSVARKVASGATCDLYIANTSY